MELSVNLSNLSWRYEPETAAALYRTAGFTAVDYSLMELLNDDCVLIKENWQKEAEQIRNRILAQGLKINQTHAPFSFCGWNDETQYREIIYPRIFRAVAVSGIFGAKVAVVHPIHDTVYAGHEEELFEKNMAFYRNLLPVCREYHIKIGIENMYRVDERRKQIMHDTCSQTDEFIRYIDTLNSEYIVACLDTGHYGLPMQKDEVQLLTLTIDTSSRLPTEASLPRWFSWSTHFYSVVTNIPL